MKIIAVTQRETIVEKPALESRDSLDRKWFSFFSEAGIIPLILPNELMLVKKIFSEFEIDGILLTGGGDIKSCGGKDKKREEVEEFLIKRAIVKKVPLLAVCRGMQKVQDVFKIALEETPNHVVGKQKILINGKEELVNSFHRFGTKENNAREFDIFAIAKDGVVKAIKHKKHKITALMWHPERMKPFRKDDLKIFTKAFE